MSEMNQRLPDNSLTRVVLSRLFYGLPYSGSNDRIYEETLEVIAAKLRKMKLLSRFIQSGRANNSPGCFKQAIALGSFPARAELALLCFNQNLAYAECKKAFELVKDGHSFGCSDCSGMFAHYYVTGCRGIVIPCDETAYCLACASAAAGSCFGKMALANFLKSLLGPIDPDEETFYVLWSDPFIRNFASPRLNVPVEDVPAENVPIEEDSFKDWSESDLEDWFEPDRDILSKSDIRRIAKILIEEIQQDHALNPNSSKVWLNLPAL